MNPYESPEPVELEVASPARPRWWATIMKLVVCTLLLLALWGDGAVGIGRDHYSRDYGFIGYYRYEQVRGVVTRSEIKPAELTFTIICTLAIVIFAIDRVRRHFLAKNRGPVIRANHRVTEGTETNA